MLLNGLTDNDPEGLNNPYVPGIIANLKFEDQKKFHENQLVGSGTV
jgi:hypothetical protein